MDDDRTLRAIRQIGAEDDLIGSFTLRLYWDPADPEDERVFRVDFEIYEVVGVCDDGRQLMYLRDSAPGGPVADLEHAEAAATGFVNCAGCTQLNIAAVHVDNREALIRLLNAIETAREECALAMPGSDVILEY